LGVLRSQNITRLISINVLMIWVLESSKSTIAKSHKHSAYGRIPPMIIVHYSCHDCGLEKVPCEVPEREKSADVGDWVFRILTESLAHDHRRRSPVCMAQRVHEVLIPTAGVEYIGGPAVQ